VSIELVLQHLKSNSKHDWFCQVDDDQCLITGWRTLAPQRYGLLALILIMMGLLYQIIFCTLASILLILYATQRFSIRIDPYHGLCVTYYALAIIPYRKKYAPLTSVLLIEDIMDPYPSSSLFDFKTPVPKMIQNNRIIQTGSVDVFLQHSLIPKWSHLLIHCEYERALKLQKLFKKEVQRISILRLTQNEGEKLEYFEEEPGEWIICLIELFPKIFAPRRISTLNSYKMSWWAPRWQLGITLVLMTFCLVFITPYIPTLACTTYLIFILIFLSQREVLLVDRQSLRWERHVLGINVSYQQWNTINSVLNTHLYAPSGISVLIYDKMYQHGKEFGHTWDAAWIHQELIRILEEQTQVQ
jgi:hypothetical protein